MQPATTVIRNADFVVAWSEQSGSHVYLRGQDVAFAGNAFVSVGGRFEGEAGREIDGRNLMVMPGLINIHTHANSEPGNKGLLDDVAALVSRTSRARAWAGAPLRRAGHPSAPRRRDPGW